MILTFPMKVILNDIATATTATFYLCEKIEFDEVIYYQRFKCKNYYSGIIFSWSSDYKKNQHS